ncbi:hypothetical protein Ddye_015850, partial [Dipteronia dyeriana]
RAPTSIERWQRDGPNLKTSDRRATVSTREKREATALSVGDKPVHQSDSATIYAAEMRATGTNEIKPGGIGATAQSAATHPERTLLLGAKTTISVVLAVTNQLKKMLKTPEEEWYEGKLTCHDHFDDIEVIDDALNQVPTEIVVEDCRRFMSSCFGNFMMMHRCMKFSGDVIHRLLLREVHHTGPSDEMHFMLGNQKVRFSKIEFCLNTELQFDVVLDTSRYAIVGNGIHEHYFTSRDEISFRELKDVLSLSQFQQAYDSVKLYLLYMLNWILMGLDMRVKIPVWQFRLVEDLDAFIAFPRGVQVYNHSTFPFKHALDE